MNSLFSYGSPLWNFMEKIVHFLWLSILWLICCLPIITIGASTTALYTVALKYVRKEDGYLTENFLSSFKSNFKQSTIIWLLSLMTGSILSIGLIMYFRMDHASIIEFVLMTVFVSIFVAFLFASTYVYALLSTFENSTFRTIINAFIMALSHPAISITMCCFTFLILVVGMNIFPPLLFIAPALIACINSRFIHKIFDQYKPESNYGEQELS